MSEAKQKLDAAKAFCKKHILECCAEILEWKNTARLRNGKVREVAEVANFDENYSLAMAESMVVSQAMRSLIETAAELDRLKTVNADLLAMVKDLLHCLDTEANERDEFYPRMRQQARELIENVTGEKQ